ncbi:hypothetical protein OROMI_012372 [Orobanche minor]
MGDDVEPYLVVRIIEVLQSAFRAGHIQVADYISFHITLLSRFRVYPEIGDDYLVFQMVEKIIVDQICSEMPMDNKCAFLRLLVTLDLKQTRLSDQSVISLSYVLPKYLVDVVSNVGEDDLELASVKSVKRRHYYLLPSFYLFYGGKRLLNLVLHVMGSWISEVSSSLGSPGHINLSVGRSTMVRAVGSVLSHMYRDVKIRQILSTCNIETEIILQNLLNVLSSEETKLTLEERHNFQTVYDRLRAITTDKQHAS